MMCFFAGDFGFGCCGLSVLVIRYCAGVITETMRTIALRGSFTIERSDHPFALFFNFVDGWMDGWMVG